MSIGSSSGIAFSGLGSGIDTDSIISRMMQLQQVPIQRLQIRQQQIQAKMDLMSQFRGQLRTLANSATGLSNKASFSTTKVTNGDDSVATITGAGAATGAFDLKVFKLAQAHKISSSSVANATDALNKTGTFKVNDKSITVEASDNLASIARKINDSDSGVTASVIDGGNGQATMTLTAKNTGLTNAIKLTDGAQILKSLGFVSGGDPIMEERQVSNTFTGNARKLEDYIDTNKATLTFIDKFGMDHEIEFDKNDKMNDVLAAIEGSALVSDGALTLTVGSQDINLRANSALADLGEALSDSDKKVEFTRKSLANYEIKETTSELVQVGSTPTAIAHTLVNAQNAEIEIDGVRISSEKNTIDSAIQGATITLKKAAEDGSAKTSFTVSQDTGSAKGLVKGFIDSFNSLSSFLKTHSSFNAETYETGMLFGDSTAISVESQLSRMIMDVIPGTSGTYTTLSSVGISYDAEGGVKIDEAKLESALASDPNAVAKLFATTGTTTSQSLEFVSATNKTGSSGTGDFGVNITQVATKGSSALTVDTGARGRGYNLKFSGASFGADVTVAITPGMTNQQIVDAVNSNTKLKDSLSAKIDGTKVVFESKRYGISGDFSVTSTDASNNVVRTAGLDVAGTINGEDATGNGQFLTGKAGNKTTDGLQILYTGTTTGSVGRVKVTKGATSMFSDQLEGLLALNTGTLSGTDKALQDQYDDLSNDINRLSSSLALREQMLRDKFLAMETAISRAQSQGQRLSALRSA